MPFININLNEVVKFTVTLEKIRKSALPSAIRGTLNDAAFHVKMKTMPSESNAKFINRSPNFFKANSKVDKAVGFDIPTMRSTVGFFETGLRGKNNFSVQDLKQQEHSGDIDGRSFIPLDTARQGNNHTSLVKPANRLSRITNIVDYRKMGPGTKKQQFLKAVAQAGQGGYVLGSTTKGENILWRVDAPPATSLKTGVTGMKLTPLYDFKKSRSVHVDQTSFMRIATLNSAQNLNRFYIAQANYWINKYRK